MSKDDFLEPYAREIRAQALPQIDVASRVRAEIALGPIRRLEEARMGLNCYRRVALSSAALAALTVDLAWPHYAGLRDSIAFFFVGWI